MANYKNAQITKTSKTYQNVYFWGPNTPLQDIFSWKQANMCKENSSNHKQLSQKTVSHKTSIKNKCLNTTLNLTKHRNLCEEIKMFECEGSTSRRLKRLVQKPVIDNQEEGVCVYRQICKNMHICYTTLCYWVYVPCVWDNKERQLLEKWKS